MKHIYEPTGRPMSRPVSTWHNIPPPTHKHTYYSTCISISSSSMQPKWLIHNMGHTLKHTYNYCHCGSTHLLPHGLNPIYAYLTAVGLELLLLSNYSFPSSICIFALSLSLSPLFLFSIFLFSSISSFRSPPHLQGYGVVIKKIGG